MHDTAVLARIARAVASNGNETIIEIGGGHGELTAQLREANPSSRVIVIEWDATLVAALHTAFTDDTRVDVAEGDARTVLPRIIASEGKTISPYRLVGNIPYYLTGRLFRMLGELPILPSRTVFTIQKEVAERIVAAPPHMNRLAAILQYWASPEIIMTIPNGAFTPTPHVASAVIALETRSPEPKLPARISYSSFAHALFAQPRKTVENNLYAAAKKNGVSRDAVRTAIRDAEISPSSRPQNLSVEAVETLKAALPEF